MISKEILQSTLIAKEDIAWEQLFEVLYEIFSTPFDVGEIEPQFVNREKELENIDILLAGSSWDLWKSYNFSIDKTSSNIINFWDENPSGKAVLILDGLSLREMPFLINEGTSRGYNICQSKVTGSELPSETTYFAKSLGFAQRSSLENNVGLSRLLKDAITDCVDLPWKDCIPLIKNEPNLILWHTWLDDKIHAFSEPGKGIRDIAKESQMNLTSDDFWEMIERLTTGRKLVITSDHGYAASGLFPDVANQEQSNYLKSSFKSGRYIKHVEDKENTWVPPTDIQLQTNYGSYRFVLGRRRWRSPGGYPTLVHGGLSLMEVAVPFIELSR